MGSQELFLKLVFFLKDKLFTPAVCRQSISGVFSRVVSWETHTWVAEPPSASPGVRAPRRSAGCRRWADAVAALSARVAPVLSLEASRAAGFWDFFWLLTAVVLLGWRKHVWVSGEGVPACGWDSSEGSAGCLVRMYQWIFFAAAKINAADNPGPGMSSSSGYWVSAWRSASCDCY